MMNNFLALTLTASLVGLLFATSAFADKQRLAERSLIVNVNTATVAELVTLPEIGPDIAKAIEQNRPYKRLESLLRVKGIAECTLGSIVPYIKLEGDTEPYVPEK